MIKHTTTILDNKLTILTHKNDSPSVCILFTVKFGSNNEKDGQNGIAHLLEHVVFEGTALFETAKELSAVIENVGGELNAMTSKNQTMFYVKVPKEHTQKAITVIHQIVCEPTLSEKNIEKEKEIVCHEIEMYNDEPRSYQWQLLEHNLYTNHPAKKSISGSVEDVQKLTKEHVREVYSSSYVGANSLITIAGGFTETDVKAITETFSTMNTGVELIEEFENDVTNPASIEEHKDIAQVYLAYGSIVPDAPTREAVCFDVIEAILSKGQSGWLFDACRNKEPLCYDVKASNEVDKTGSLFVISVITDVQKEQRVKDVISEQINRLLHVDTMDVESAKTYIKGKYALHLEDSLNVAQTMTEQYVEQTQEYFTQLDSITCEDVISCVPLLQTHAVVKISPK